MSAASSAVSVTLDVLVLSGVVVEESAVLLLQAVKTMLIAAVQTAVARKAEIIRFIVVFSLLMIKIPHTLHCVQEVAVYVFDRALTHL